MNGSRFEFSTFDALGFESLHSFKVQTLKFPDPRAHSSKGSSFDGASFELYTFQGPEFEFFIIRLNPCIKSKKKKIIIQNRRRGSGSSLNSTP